MGDRRFRPAHAARYDPLGAIKTRFGFMDLNQPLRRTMMTWLNDEAMTIIDGRLPLDRLMNELRARRIVIPGVSVVERMTAEAMARAEAGLIDAIDSRLDAGMRQRPGALVDDKVHDRRSRLSWLREPEPRVAADSLAAILEKLDLVRGTGAPGIAVDPRHEPRMAQFAREGRRYAAQASSRCARRAAASSCSPCCVR